MSNEVKLTDKELQKIYSEQAFPGRKSTMGYVQGLSKLEYMTAQLFSSGKITIEEAIVFSKKVIELCNKEQS